MNKLRKVFYAFHGFLESQLRPQELDARPSSMKALEAGGALGDCAWVLRGGGLLRYVFFLSGGTRNELR